jgi:hypothetical protein
MAKTAQNGKRHQLCRPRQQKRNLLFDWHFSLNEMMAEQKTLILIRH